MSDNSIPLTLERLEAMTAHLRGPVTRIIVGSPFVPDDRIVRVHNTRVNLMLIGEGAYFEACAKGVIGTGDALAQDASPSVYLGTLVEHYHGDRHRELIVDAFLSAFAAAPGEWSRAKAGP